MAAYVSQGPLGMTMMTLGNCGDIAINKVLKCLKQMHRDSEYHNCWRQLGCITFYNKLQAKLLCNFLNSHRLGVRIPRWSYKLSFMGECKIHASGNHAHLESAICFNLCYHVNVHFWDCHDEIWHVKVLKLNIPSLSCINGKVYMHSNVIL